MATSFEDVKAAMTGKTAKIRTAAAEGPHPVDIYVGARLRMRRKIAGLTQQGLAQELGITFQQVQKYERGVNRISASKLYEAAGALGVPIAYFFDGLPQTHLKEADAARPAGRLSSRGDGPELMSILAKIKSRRLRKQLLALMRTMSGDTGAEGSSET